MGTNHVQLQLGQLRMCNQVNVIETADRTRCLGMSGRACLALKVATTPKWSLTCKRQDYVNHANPYPTVLSVSGQLVVPAGQWGENSRNSEWTLLVRPSARLDDPEVAQLYCSAGTCEILTLKSPINVTAEVTIAA